ncbi:vertnin [Ambystoma mexicanum]|uniref:vertnin n=1 Tax=Ambystoma mexicanum TaxID=8296 RepID=UPI0037E78CFD
MPQEAGEPRGRMVQRRQLVQSVLQELQDATESFGLEELTCAAFEAVRTLSSFTLPSTCTRHFDGEMEVDIKAKSLYPNDAPRNMLPLTCHGGGNHLFEAASMLLWGNPTMCLELQVRTVVEMLLHKQYYINGMIDSKVMLQASRFSLCTEESPDMMNLPFTILEAIFDADIKATCFPGTFANMWHVYALASVLQCNIYSIYPMSNLKIRPYFNRLIRPRSCQWKPNTLHIMWSGQRLTNMAFRPQSFVPVVGLEELEPMSPLLEVPVEPAKTLELLNSDPLLTYSNLREKYSITKSTFYRWKRQTREHRKRAAGRYEAKHFLQCCFQDGDVVPLQRFRQLFPEISRSTYYAWKHEMLQSHFNPMSLDTNGTVLSQVTSAKEGRNRTSGEGHQDSGSLAAHDQAGVFMLDAKTYLEKCIAMNTLVPYRNFRHRFPGISRSTYYNWRRKAMKSSPDLSPESRPLCKESPSKLRLYQNTTNGNLEGSNILESRKRMRSLAALLPLKSSLRLHGRLLRRAAKRLVRKWRLPYCKFRIRYPVISCTPFWFWKTATKRRRELLGSRIPELQLLPSDLMSKKEEDEHRFKDVSPLIVDGSHVEKRTLSPVSDTISSYSLPMHEPDEARVFVMDVIATSQFKVQAKLFLQQRFASKNFPSYKEFRTLFPFTARSTYYMWKRALHDGMTLVDA